MGFNISKMVKNTKQTKTINKDIIASEIAAELGLSKVQSHEIVGDILDAMLNIIQTEEKLRIPYFGTFTLKNKNSRVGRNPRTKEEYEIPARQLVTFKASDFFRHYVNDN